MTPPITVFTKNNCPRCDFVKRWFLKNKIDTPELIRYINVETDTTPRAEFHNLSPRDHVIQNYDRAMPVIVTNNAWWTGVNPEKMKAAILELII